MQNDLFFSQCNKGSFLKFTLLVFVGMLVTPGGILGQEPPPPGGINLLPGYHHKIEQGIDTRTGSIWKKNGLRIRYDIGKLAGNQTECQSSCNWKEAWRKEQVVNGQKFICVFTNTGWFNVYFPKSYANFYARVHSESELADMLLMLFTFQSAQPAAATVK